MREFTNDPQEAIEKGSIKYDGGKAPVYRGFIAYFPRAIEAVATVSAFGARKYSWGGWTTVSDGISRYSDAAVRHLLDRAKGEVLDHDSRLDVLAHEAWNALAVLELYLREKEKNESSQSS